jgi:hypothetical protein
MKQPFGTAPLHVEGFGPVFGQHEIDEVFARYVDASGVIISVKCELNDRLSNAAELAREILLRGGVELRAACEGRAATQASAAMSVLWNSTDAARDTWRLVESKFNDAVAHRGEEWADEYAEPSFNRALSSLLYIHGDTLVAVAQAFLSAPTSNVEIVFETAQWLGAVDHDQTKYYRRSVLEKLLDAVSPRIRHGAASGLAAMNDPSALGAVRRARDRERDRNRLLHAYLELVVSQLERTRACRNS